MMEEIFNIFGRIKEIQIYVFLAILLISLKYIFYKAIRDEYAELKSFFPSCASIKISSFSTATFMLLVIGSGILGGLLSLPALGFTMEEDKIIYYPILFFTILFVGLLVYWRYSLEVIKKAFYE